MHIYLLIHINFSMVLFLILALALWFSWTIMLDRMWNKSFQTKFFQNLPATPMYQNKQYYWNMAHWIGVTWGKKSYALITFHQAFIFSPCIFFSLLGQIKSNCMYWLHWKSEWNRTEPNELDELNTQNHSTRWWAILTDMLSCICMLN